MSHSRLALLAAASAVLACTPPPLSHDAVGELPVPSGLVNHGLVESGLSSAGFSMWFNKDPDRSSATMGNLVRCAVPAGSTRTWQNPSTGVSYTWRGEMGLTPKWSTGSPATPLERHLIAVCLASLRNNPAPEPAQLAHSRG